MSKGLNNRLAGQVGEYLVCAELGRRGLIATSFTGNVPEFDLIVADGSLKTLPVQVKTSRGLSWPTKETVFYTQEEGSSRDMRWELSKLDIQTRLETPAEL